MMARTAVLPLLCGGAILLLFQFVLFLGYVPSTSMEPTIMAGSWILGNRLYSELRRGDIVIFEREGTYLVKRIVAIPGDMVYIDDMTRSVSVNEAIPDASRVLRVPDGRYFVLGDNRNNSEDSRFAEVQNINEKYIKGKVWFCIYPADQIGFVKD